MQSGSMMTMVKGVALGMAVGAAVGVAGKNMIDHNPKLKKKANKAMRTMGSMLDTAQYMLR